MLKKLSSSVLVVLILLLAVSSYAEDRKIPILVYHNIKLGSNDYFLKPEVFEKHLHWIKSSGYETVTFYDVAAGKLPERPIILTFDDGQRNHWDVFKKLEIRGMKGVFFIVEEYSPLTKKQIKLMSDQGMEIGSHGMTHASLTKVNLANLWYEVNGSKSALEKIIEKKVITFAYPYGRYNKTVLEVMAETKYQYGRTTDEAVAYFGQDRDFKLPVILIHHGTKDLSTVLK